MKRILIVSGALLVGAVVLFTALRGAPLAVETAEVARHTVREFVTEEAKTRLADEYVVDMPLSGTVEPAALEVGDPVERGQTLARIDPHDLEQELRAVEALIEQARARILGVDATKPKQEAIEVAAVVVKERENGSAMARRDREIASIEHELAKRDYDRVVRLRQEGVTSQAAMDESERRYRSAVEALRRAELAEEAARKALEIARLSLREIEESVDDNEYLRGVHGAEVRQYQARRDMLHRDLERTNVVSPVGGYMLEKHIEERRVLPAGAPLMRVGDMASIEIESDILSEEVGRITVGAEVEVTGKALGGAVVPGRVKRIYPAGFKKISALGIEQQRVRILIDFDNEPHRLRPGVSLDIAVITAESPDVLAVPERAVFRHGAGWAVFTVRDGRARLNPVEVGLRNDDWAEIAAGLAPGDTVVAETRNELADGVRVESLGG